VSRLLTARVVAEQLGLCTETVLLWVRQGKLPAFKLPSGAIRIRESDLDRWLEERATGRSERPQLTRSDEQLTGAAHPTVHSLPTNNASGANRTPDEKE